MTFTPKTPYLTTDGIVEIYNSSNEFLGIVLIKRKYPPLGLALPGGFVEIEEKVEDACVREMKEEISFDVEIEEMLGVYSDPKRDKRFHTMSIVYVCRAYGVPKGADDAKEAFLISIEKLQLNLLVFDHGDILKDYLKRFHSNIII